MTFWFCAGHEVVKRLVRAFLAGEDEIVAIILHHFGDGLAGEEVVAEINGPQWAKPFAMLMVPPLHSVAFAILLLGTILSRDEFGIQRDHPGMARRHDRCRQQGVVVIDLAIGVRARQAIRAAELFRAKILGSVPGQENSATQPSKGLA